MKRIINSCLMAGCFSCTSCLFGDHAEINRAVRHGAELCMTFRVTDTRGVPVTNAQATAYFYFLHKDGSEEKTFVTDTNGMCMVKGLCSSEVLGTFSKEGYYTSGFGRKVLTAYPMPASALKDGKWQPWNPTVEITMKEKRNPIPMYAKSVTIKLPKNGEMFGFDFKIGDLVKPHGTGEQADLVFSCAIEQKSAAVQDYKKELFITAVREEEGVIVNKNERSAFKSAYEAQESGYAPQYYSVLDMTPTKMLQKAELAETEYLTFRSRITRDAEGNIISSHYGKIYRISYGSADEKLEGAWVGITYYFNPTPNDRNIEYNPDENLFDKRKFRGMQP